MGHRRQPDHYNRRAHAEGMPARSVYKLEEIDEKADLFPRGVRVLDLGCRPGSWSAWVRQRGGAEARILGIDLEEVQGFPGTFLRMSVDDLTPERVRAELGGPPQVVLSDMAPSTSGARDLDHLRQVALAEAALAVATQVLVPGGAFVCKVFDGRDANAFVAATRAAFAEVRRVRPKATRRESREFFVVARGFRPPAPTPPGATA